MINFSLSQPAQPCNFYIFDFFVFMFLFRFNILMHLSHSQAYLIDVLVTATDVDRKIKYVLLKVISVLRNLIAGIWNNFIQLRSTEASVDSLFYQQVSIEHAVLGHHRKQPEVAAFTLRAWDLYPKGFHFINEAPYSFFMVDIALFVKVFEALVNK